MILRYARPTVAICTDDWTLPLHRWWRLVGEGSNGENGFPCFPGFVEGDFLFWALLRYLLGFIFWGLLKQILVFLVLLKVEVPFQGLLCFVLSSFLQISRVFKRRRHFAMERKPLGDGRFCSLLLPTGFFGCPFLTHSPLKRSTLWKWVMQNPYKIT